MILRAIQLIAAAAALSWTDGSSPSSLADAGRQTVVALVGEDVLLPCSFDVSSTDEFPTIEWSKEGLTPDVVLLHRDGCEIQEMKNVLYEYRTSLVLRALRDGNLALRLAALRHGDAGRYRCKTLWREGPDHVREVELIVAAVAVPTLTVMAMGIDGVEVLCDSGCWMPRPLMELQGDEGEVIHPQALEEERRSLQGCYRLRMKAELQSATHSVTCRVRQHEFNHIRHTTIKLPELCLFHHRTVGVAVGLTAMCCSALFALLVYLRNTWKKNRRRPLQRASTDETSVNMGQEGRQLLPTNQTNGGGANCTSEGGCSRPNSPTTSCASTPGNVNRTPVLERQDSVSTADHSSSSPVCANTPLTRRPPLTKQDSFSSGYQSANSSVTGEAPPIRSDGPTHGGVQSSNPPLKKNAVSERTDKARKPDSQKQRVTAAAPAPATAPAVAVAPRHIQKNQRESNRHVNPPVRRTSLHVSPQRSSNRYSTLANLSDSH